MEKIWNMTKPVIIVMLALIGFFASNQAAPKWLFIIIIAVSFILRGKAIAEGFKIIFSKKA